MLRTRFSLSRRDLSLAGAALPLLSTAALLRAADPDLSALSPMTGGARPIDAAERRARLARAQSLPVIASGGVAGIGDIRLLAIHARDGIEGVITGRALYDGRLDLATALAVAAA